MGNAGDSGIGRAWRALAGAAPHPAVAAVMPPMLLLAYWAGGERGLVGVAAALSALTLAAGLTWRRRGSSAGRDGETGLPTREAALSHLARLAEDGAVSGRRVATLAAGFDDAEEIRRRHGDGVASALLTEAACRLREVLRQDDLVVRLEGAAFAAILGNLRRADLEMLIQIAARVQRRLTEPFHIEGATIHPTVSLGFCLPHRAPDRTGAGLLTGAERALKEARSETGGAIRAYSEGMRAREQRNADLADEVREALARGEIRPWFQPRVSTDTGCVTGVEALARWDRGEGDVQGPGDFLPAIEAAGLTDRLAETVLTHSLAALADWDAAGLQVPGVSINVGPPELRNPLFIDRVRWELDRYDIEPSRLSFEIREVGANGPQGDICLRTLRTLSRLGCPISADDFGNTAASIGDLDRLGIRTVNIDRGFVARVDSDPDQQRLMAAILSLAERLGLETLAVGVETHAEHAMLAQLGCGSVQGRAVAPPMPAPKLAAWLDEHRRRTGDVVLPTTAEPRPGEARGGKTA